MLKKAASGVPCLRRSGFAQAGRPFAVLTYSMYAPRVKMAAALPVEGRVLARLGWAGQTTDFFEHSPQLMLVVCTCPNNRRHLKRMGYGFATPKGVGLSLVVRRS